MKKLRKCSICGDICQTNVKLKWRRNSDKVIFHVCLACAEGKKVCEHSVTKVSTNTATTYIED